MKEIYAVIAYIARYWFALLTVVILWRAMLWIRKDADRMARMQRKLPDAGFIGEWAVIESGDEGLAKGAALSAPRDGWIGSARACDVRVKSRDVPARAARFYLRPDGLHLLPRHSGSILVDGEIVRREAVLRHGATLTVGGVTLQLRLFAGVLLKGEVPVKKKRARPLAARGAEALDEDAAPGPTELPKPALTMPKRRQRRQTSATNTPRAPEA